MNPLKKPLDFENKAILARKTQKIGILPQDEFEALLEYLFTLVGLPIGNRPIKAEKEMLIQFIRANFSYLGVGEVKNAFEMAVSDRLSVDCNHNGYFSGKYIGMILAAYKRFSAPILEQVKPNEEKMIELPKTECDWTETWEALKNGESGLIPSPIFKWAEKKGIIKYTNSEKEEFVRKAQIKLTLDANQLTIPDGDIVELKKRYKNPKDVLVLNEAQRIAVRTFLKIK